jgi:serine/threonine protein kinase
MLTFSSEAVASSSSSFESVADSEGNKFFYKKTDLIATGLEGSVYRARDPNGQSVVLKMFKGFDDKFCLEAYAREIQVLKREGSLIASSLVPNSPEQCFVVLPLFPGVTLREWLYELDDSGVVAKKAVQQRDSVAYHLIRDFHAMNQLGIIHCDLKTDNIIVDPISGTAKIIDMGQAFFNDLYNEGKSAFEEYEGMGAFIFAAPEGEIDHAVNSTKTDMYTLGMILASMYCDAIYELEPYKNIKFSSSRTLECRNYLEDVIGSNVLDNPRMPEGLFELVRHVTQINPVDRPENIACAKGIEKIPELRDLVEIQARSKKLLQILAEYKKTPKRVRELLVSSDDLPLVKRRLNALVNDFKVSRKDKVFIKRTMELIECFTVIQVNQLRGANVEDVLLSMTMTDSLLKHAEGYRGLSSSSILPMMRQSIEYSPEGEKLYKTAMRIQGLEHPDAILHELFTLLLKIEVRAIHSEIEGLSLKKKIKLQSSSPKAGETPEFVRRHFVSQLQRMEVTISPDIQVAANSASSSTPKRKKMGFF